MSYYQRVMKLSVFALLGAGSVVAARQSIAWCFGYYVDGKIVVPGPVPDDYPHKVQFELGMLLDSDNVVGNGVWEKLPLARRDNVQYWTIFKDLLYLDNSPGAYGPVGFKDPKKLKGGEKTKYWASAWGPIYFSPDPGNNNGFISGYQLQQVEGYSNVKELWWNQTLYDAQLAGEDLNSEPFPFCYNDEPVVLGYEDHPY